MGEKHPGLDAWSQASAGNVIAPPHRVRVGLGLVGAMVGAVIGAAVWAGIAQASGMELGIIAWAVGGLAGLGALLGGGAPAAPLQTLAAIWAVAGLVLAKYGMVALVMMDLASAEGVDISFFDGIIFEAFTSVFTEMLSPYDLLWGALALGTAWKIPGPPTAA